ncbi:PhoH family protein [Bacillus carboniphilus]|uniref:PhoH-like protein n=1 Tax=Bacillus carboniphilus TaxID=86663 RepID=A0ABY9K2D7_9BACI|nr:PhoH family protein [Bacillus carboniphilus]WLR43985.1 PhoH family protein [Bacillus carboniphilus]
MTEGLVTIEEQIQNSEEALKLFGNHDANLKLIEKELNVSIVTRGESIGVIGESNKVTLVNSLLKHLLALIRRGVNISNQDVIYAIRILNEGKIEQIVDLLDEEITKDVKGKPIVVKTLGQRHYISALTRYDLTFAIGPAGTGKTFLAVVMAVKALKNGDVKKIILTRPAVEAGENLGFLPGDLKDKVDPYLQPLYDSLYNVLGTDHTLRLIERGIIEIAPLAYMRGRTLDDAFVILDEAQNTTTAQMKMFLTRLGFGSKMVVTGDISQVDLPKKIDSGLQVAKKLFQPIDDIAVIELQQGDVVRHPLVGKIIEAYNTLDEV